MFETLSPGFVFEAVAECCWCWRREVRHVCYGSVIIRAAAYFKVVKEPVCCGAKELAFCFGIVPVFHTTVTGVEIFVAAGAVDEGLL